MAPATLHIRPLCIISIIAVLSATMTSIALTGFGNVSIAQGQANVTSSSLSSLTTEQKAAICSPSNLKLKFVNSTESEICGIPTSSTPASNSTTPTNGKQSPLPSSLYDQGYAKGVSDAKLVLTRFPSSSTMTPDEVDCDSSIDPQTSNQRYCSGYQHGFADTINNELLGK